MTGDIPSALKAERIMGQIGPPHRFLAAMSTFAFVDKMMGRGVWTCIWVGEVQMGGIQPRTQEPWQRRQRGLNELLKRKLLPGQPIADIVLAGLIVRVGTRCAYYLKPDVGICIRL